MAGGATTRQYVKLTEDQDAPMEEIKSEELNQPIRVPQLEVHRCIECGQALPESYQPPADEACTTGIFGCFEDTESCRILFHCYALDAGLTGFFCPCVLSGHHVEKIEEVIPWKSACVCHAICVEGGIVLAAATALFHGIDPKTSFLIGEGLLFGWWMCGILVFFSNLCKRNTISRK